MVQTLSNVPPTFKMFICLCLWYYTFWGLGWGARTKEMGLSLCIYLWSLPLTLILIYYVQCDIDNPQVDVNQLDDFCSKHNIGGW